MNFTTCASCKELLQVTYTGQESHPSCPQTPAELQAREFVDAVQRGDEAEVHRLEKLINLPTAPKLGPAAIWYVSIGWPVFPLLPNSKQPATKHGFKDATLDPDRIRSWWKAHPESNIGLPTGVAFDVIDIDGPTGIQSLADLAPGVIPDLHGKVGTPRGFHLYVKPTGDGNKAGVKPGIDYRGVGGYVVGVPSQIDFKRYQWLIKPSPEIQKRAAA